MVYYEQNDSPLLFLNLITQDTFVKKKQKLSDIFKRITTSTKEFAKVKESTSSKQSLQIQLVPISFDIHTTVENIKPLSNMELRREKEES